MARTVAAPDHTDGAAIRRLAETLAGHGFDAGRVQEVISSGSPGLFGLAPLPLIARRLDAGDPVGTLIALFLHGVAVPERAAAGALDPLGLDGAERLRLVQIADGLVTATVRIGPFGSLLLASDRGRDPFREFVMAGAGSSRTLAQLTIRRPVRTVLDLGTGSGVHALLAAPHAERVTAIDVNPRALAFARFNAHLNGIDNIEFLEGSWFEPVAGRQFDQVICNPPFVVVPEGEFLFRDGCEGGVGDRVSRRLVEAAPAHLTDGGVAQFLVNWVHASTGHWSDPIRPWIADSGCDAWLLRGATDDAARYAMVWNQHLAGDPAAHAASIERWLAWFEREGIAAIGFGLLTLRRRPGVTWFRADEMPDQAGPAAGAQLEAALDAHDVLGRFRDLGELLHTRPVTNPDHRLEQVLAFRNGRYEVERARIRLNAPLAFTADVDVFAATLLTLLDGARTLAQAIELAAPVLDRVPDDLPRVASELVASMVVLGLARLARPGEG